jgi:hypothetical protein
VYSKFRIYKIDPNDLEVLEPEPAPLLGGGKSRMCSVGVDEPSCQIVFEDFFPGGVYHWTMWQDQIDLVTQGKAEITYREPPSLDKECSVIAEAPCLYLIPRGTRITWRVLGNEIYRHISIDFPNPGFPAKLAKSVKEAQSAK